MFTFIEINSLKDLEQLKKLLPNEFAPASVAKKLQSGLTEAVKGVLIEHDYVDKDYRSTYYNFYSKKGQSYDRNCVRLHFFDGTVSFEESTLRLHYEPAHSPPESLDQHYFGYMVLRPSRVGTIGRSVINADVRRGTYGRIIIARHKVHVLGNTLVVKGFPWMQQHSDISVCAHAASWAILRHYSQRFPDYAEKTLHDITLMAEPRNPGGLVPANGLEMQKAETILSKAGTYPLRIAREFDDHDDESFYRQLAACIESGFPIFAALHNKEHAIAVVGYRWREISSPPTGDLRFAWDEMDSLIVIDDNHLPYENLQTSESKSRRTARDIDTFLVPFPEKIYYPPAAVESLITSIYGFSGQLRIPPQDDAIIRYFLTTGSALRRFVRERESAFDPKLINVLMDLPLTQFVWIIEIASEAEWNVNKLSVRAIFDATASYFERLPYWVMYSKERMIVFDRQSTGIEDADRMQFLDFGGGGMAAIERMEVNLSRITDK